MDVSYRVSCDGSVVGRVRLEADGLYTRIFCSCTPPPGPIYRLWMQGKTGRLSLGIPVPEGGQFVLRRTIPKRALEIADPVFMLLPPEHFVPVEEGKPISHFELIGRSRFEIVDGVPGLWMPWDAPA